MPLPPNSFLYKSPQTFHQFVNEELAPTKQANDLLNAAMDNLSSFLKSYSRFNVKAVIKGGSVGKGTTVRGRSDLDVVVFLNDLSGDPNEVKSIIPQLATELKRYNSVYSGSVITVRYDSEFLVSVMLYPAGFNTEGIEVDILPNYDYIGNRGTEWLYTEFGKMTPLPRHTTPLYYQTRKTGKDWVYKDMTQADITTRSKYSSALVELQVDFIKSRPPALKNLIRLVKYWKKHFETLDMFIQQAKRLPTSYPLELLTIHCWEAEGEPAQFNMAAGLKSVLMKLTDPSRIHCVWNKNYDPRQYKKYIDELKEEAHDKPFILDPANPFNNTAAQFDTWPEVKQMALESLARLSDVIVNSRWIA